MSKSNWMEASSCGIFCRENFSWESVMLHYTMEDDGEQLKWGRYFVKVTR